MSPWSVLGAGASDDARWSPERDSPPARPSTSSSVLSVCNACDLCTISVRTFLFSIFLDLMHDQRENLRDGEVVRERADFDPTVHNRTPSASPSNPLDSPHSS